MAKVLVVDDDQTVLRLVEKAMAGGDVCVLKADNAEDGLDAIRRESPDALLLDIMLPDVSGLEMARQVRALDPRLPVTFITISDDSDKAIEAMKLGAYDYLLKPLDVEKVQDVIERALETRRRMQVPVRMPEPNRQPDDGQEILVGRSPQMMNVYKEIGRVAGQDVAVLICGESGTGKELIARAIYHHSARKDGCFLAVNCAALSDTLLESELFGHEKGAFTGADRRRIGKFEQCNSGTIFLDEVGDMSPATQSKVLRLLQEQRFERVGGTETIETDVRIISATNRDLEQMIEDGEFRLDLYHRLNGYRIDLPPLRQRGDDLDQLLKHFLHRMNRELGKDIHGISDEARDMLVKYSWPGNIREMQGTLRKAMLIATGPVLVPEFFPQLNGVETQPLGRVSTNGELPRKDMERFIDQREAAGSNDLYAETLDMMERYLITRILNDTGGNQSKAAERLGITRGSLRHKIRALGVTIDHVVQPGDKSEDDDG